MTSQNLKPGWQMVQFGNIAENIAVRVDPSEAQTDVYVGLEHLDPESLHLRKWGHPSDVTGQKLAFEKGDVIFGRRRAYQRKLAVAEFDGICSAHAMVVRAKPEMILPEFLPFFLQSDMFMERAIEISVGSLSPTINWKTLRVQEFPLPPIEEQKRIAEILWAADEAVVRYSKALTSLESLQSVAMADSFRSDSNGIVFERAEDICEKVSVGIVIKPASYYVKHGGVPALRSLNVFPGRFDLRELVHISEEGSKKNRKSELRTGDVVVVRTGRPGDACVVQQKQEGFNAIDLIIVRPGEAVLPEYLCAFVNSELAKRQFRRGIAGTAQAHFNIGEFKKLHIPIIKIEEQKRLLARLAVIQAQILEVSEHLQRLQRSGKSLLNSAVWQVARV